MTINHSLIFGFAFTLFIPFSPKHDSTFLNLVCTVPLLLLYNTMSSANIILQDAVSQMPSFNLSIMIANRKQLDVAFSCNPTLTQNSSVVPTSLNCFYATIIQCSTFLSHSAIPLLVPCHVLSLSLQTHNAVLCPFLYFSINDPIANIALIVLFLG